MEMSAVWETATREGYAEEDKLKTRQSHTREVRKL